MCGLVPGGTRIYTFHLKLFYPLVLGYNISYSGVGFCVARSLIGNGNAKAMNCGGRAIDRVSHAFLSLNNIVALKGKLGLTLLYKDMKQTNYLKLFSFFAFLLFGGVSCWATAESLHLLLASWPKIFCYLVAIGFFVVASIGTKLMVDSLNQKIYVEGRTGKLFGGILLVLIFWLVISMPTNTHTFIYRNVISERVNNDIDVTMGYLDDIKNNTLNIKKWEELIANRQEAVRKYQNLVIGEVTQPNDPGSGPNTKTILEQLESELGYKIDEYRPKGNITSQSEIVKACEYYNDRFSNVINTIIPKYYKGRMERPNETKFTQAVNAYNELSDLKEKIEAGRKSKGSSSDIVDLNSADDMHNIVIPCINSGYQAVNSNSDIVIFKNGDEIKYKADPVITDTQRMTSIFEVWGDYLSGKFGGHGFLWWILLAILVDVAAFIFFDIAFKKSN